jgi:hypothetical protein
MTTDTTDTTNQAYMGSADPSSASSHFNTWSFLISQALTKVRTASAVKVVACTNSGGLSPAGTVDVQPLVHQLDGYGQPTPHGTIFGRPYLRWQGGTNAIIMDPVAGDTGLLVCCDRDTSNVLSALAPANPGSLRKFDFADGFYIQAIGAGTPTQFIQFAAAGITVTSPTLITLQAPTVAVQGNLTVSGSTTGTGDGVFSGTDVHTHTHSGVTVGSGNTGAPV